jgi:shikimate dehydrogenase
MKKFGLIGASLKHSYSPKYFTEKFQKLGLDDHSYQAFELPSIESFPALLQEHPELCGLNVTIPYKQSVITYLDEVNDVVQKTGACNCIRIFNGRTKGFNTDVPGFWDALKVLIKPQHSSALVLGTGGASKAVGFALQQAGIPYRLVSRSSSGNVLGYEDLNKKIMEEHLLVINTTPAGMYPMVDEAPSIPYQYLGPGHLLYDLIYNPAKTEFMKRGEARGAAIENGHGMWLAQAEASWKIWNDPNL